MRRSVMIPAGDCLGNHSLSEVKGATQVRNDAKYSRRGSERPSLGSLSKFFATIHPDKHHVRASRRGHVRVGAQRCVGTIKGGDDQHCPADESASVFPREADAHCNMCALGL